MIKKSDHGPESVSTQAEPKPKSQNPVLSQEEEIKRRVHSPMRWIAPTLLFIQALKQHRQISQIGNSHLLLQKCG